MARLLLLLAIGALALVALAPSAGAAPISVRACSSGDSNHVYGLKAFRGARCGSALVIASRLGARFDRPGDFSGQMSSARISQRDASAKRYACRWQAASPNRQIVLWSCNRKSTVVTWVWRFHAL